MASFLVRFLTLVGSLLLALPPGWCCMLWPQAPAQETRTAASQTRPCCGQCEPEGKPPAPSPGKPAPLPAGKCPCHDRDTTSPDAPKGVGPHLLAPATPLVVGPPPCWAGSGRHVDPPAFVSNPLRLLNCVWLC